MAPVRATVLGIGTAVREAVRAAADRAVPYGTTLPLRVPDVTAPWLARALGLPADAINAVRILGHDSGTAARARIAVSSDSGLPATLFLKLMPRNYLQHVLMNVFQLGAREVLAYRALGENPQVRVPYCHLAEIDPVRGRMQPREASRVGVERAVAGVRAHDSFALLAELIAAAPPPPPDILE